MNNTRRIAEFVAETSASQIPPAAYAAARDAILDSLGVALAGSQDQAATIAAGLVRDETTAEQASLFGQGFRSSSSGAAFVNGVAGHALDFDASFSIGGQPMASLAHAAFALGEPRHVSGKELLAAYIVGFEVAGKLSWAAPTHTHIGGWHSTGTLGTLGSAAVAARLLGLNADQVCTALGMATSMASGIATNFGTMSKPLHAGLAARNGVVAASLAQRGFTAHQAIFDGEEGFFGTFARGLEVDTTPFERLGQSYDIEQGVRFKAYPCGGLAHTAVDAVLGLCRDGQVDPSLIGRIEVGVTARTASRIVPTLPETELQAKFSMAYILARAALDGALVPDTFSEEAIRDQAAISMARKVKMHVDAELETVASISQPSRVTITLRDGRHLYREVLNAKGTPEAPMSPAELEAKFELCARRVLGTEAVRSVVEAVRGLDDLADVTTITSILIAG